MKALVSKDNCGPKSLIIEEIKTSFKLAPNEALVSVKACGLNRADLIQSYGKYPAPKDSIHPEVLGLEFSGSVMEIGSNIKSLDINDKVMGITASAAMSQMVKVDARTLIKIPAKMSFEQAACIPEAFITAYDALILQAKAKKGDSLLITAIGSSVGLAALQIGSAYSMTTIGCSRNIDKINQAIELGLNHGIDQGDYTNQVLEITSNLGVNNILELVGGQNVSYDIACAGYLAKIVLIGLIAGIKCEINLASVLSKRISIIGTTLRSRPIDEKIKLIMSFKKDLIPLFDKNILKPNLYKIYSFEDYYNAFCELEKNHNFGKIVLSLDSL